MLSPSSRDQIKAILLRIASGQSVTLKERVFVHQIADKDQSIESWLKRARRKQQFETSKDSIDDLLINLDLGSMEPNGSYNPKNGDLGDWFTGAPSWLSRS